MSKTVSYQIRLSDTEKAEAFAVFRELGINPAQAVRLFLRQVVETHAIPFPIREPTVRCPLGSEHIPNAKTAKALTDLQAKTNTKRFTSVDDLFADLNHYNNLISLTPP